ncbi:hypothetical protein VitviT2T_016109 [Vitis vinifera]|uniref:Uncharacterized protein n=2 Tax=Vitis vinifera TaxID=29760 RepID=A0ABY9CS38_VITVI|nr:hypothetical protein VitviT2T_016109 [Vitis vinifera]
MIYATPASSPVQSSECHHMLLYSTLCNDRLHHETFSSITPAIGLSITSKSDSKIMDHSRVTDDFIESTLEFQRKILEHSSFGKKAHVPQAMDYLPRAPRCQRPERRLNVWCFGCSVF